MNADQCHTRAAECAANALIAVDEVVSLEFLRLAAQWRAMAVRNIFLGSADSLNAMPLSLGLAQPAIGTIGGKV
jgi:hypothetical protein